MALKKKTQWPRIYIGPIRRNGLLHRMQVFADGYPAAVQDLLTIHPELNDFFVSLSELPAALQELRTIGTDLNTKYLTTQKQILGGLTYVSL